MTTWHYTLDIIDAWQAAEHHDGNVEKLAALCTDIATKLYALPAFEHATVRQQRITDQRLSLALNFRELAKNPALNNDLFNAWAGQLYKWGDDWGYGHLGVGHNVCWIKTQEWQR